MDKDARTRSHGIQDANLRELLGVLEEFISCIDAYTIDGPDGSRIFSGPHGAVELSAVHVRLYGLIGSALADEAPVPSERSDPDFVARRTVAGVPMYQAGGRYGLSGAIGHVFDVIDYSPRRAKSATQANRYRVDDIFSRQDLEQLRSGKNVIEHYLQRNRTDTSPPTPVPYGAPVRSRYRFQKSGDRWNIVFDDECGSFSHSVGLERICILLQQPGVEVPVQDLLRSDQFSGDELADRQAQEECQRRIEMLEEELGDTENPAKIAEAKDELSALRAVQKEIRGRHRRVRRLGDKVGAAANKVGRSIERSLTKLEGAGLKKCAIHLRAAIHSPGSRAPSYKPADADLPDWEF